VKSAAARTLAALVFFAAVVATAQDSRPDADDAPALTLEALKRADEERFDEALALLERARKARPDEAQTTTNLARMLGRRALWLARKDRAAEAEADLERGSAIAPEERHLRVLRAGLWRERGEIFRAESELGRVLLEEPSSASAFEELSRCKYDDDDLGGAMDALEAAEKLDPVRATKLKSYREKLRREFEAEKEFDRVERGSFAVKFDGKDFRSAADAVLEMLDAAERRARDWFSHTPQRRTTVVLYTRKDFSAVTGAHAWTGGLFDGKIRLPVRNFEATRAQVAKTLTHEYMHLVVRDLTRHCPTWLNEGLAQLAEGADAAEARRALRGRTLKRFSELPASWFGVSDAAEVSSWYAMGLAFAQWLIDVRGPLAVKDLLTKLDGRASFAAAFEDVFGRPFLEAEDAWRESLR
jgi:tetratricopeptide (TPR) repeat protein